MDALLDKMCRLRNDCPRQFIHKCTGYIDIASKLLKCLVERKADAAFVQLVWNSIYSALQPFSVKHQYCLAPLEELKHLLFEPNASVHRIERVLSTLNGFQLYGLEVQKEVHVLYTVMFWEASKRVLEHFLGKVPIEYKLEYVPILMLVQSAKYSDGLCRKLILQCRQMDPDEQIRLLEFRSDPITEPINPL